MASYGTVVPVDRDIAIEEIVGELPIDLYPGSLRFNGTRLNTTFGASLCMLAIQYPHAPMMANISYIQLRPRFLGTFPMLEPMSSKNGYIQNPIISDRLPIDFY